VATIGSLWLAILLSAVVVWLVGAVVWTILPHHKSDYREFPDEAAVRNALLPQNLPPGQYDIPHLSSRDEMKNPEVLKKFEQGPAGFMTVVPRGAPSMAKGMILSFLYYLAVSLVVAYVASRTIPPGAPYLAVFRITGTVAWLAYGAAVVHDAVWFGRPWNAVGKHLVDSLAYGLFTAGVFSWLWPG